MIARGLSLLFLVMSLAGCNAYTGVSARDGEVYLTGTTSFLIFGTAWVKKCVPEGATLACEDVVISTTRAGNVGAVGNVGTASGTLVMVRNGQCVLGASPLPCAEVCETLKATQPTSLTVDGGGFTNRMEVAELKSCLDAAGIPYDTK